MIVTMLSDADAVLATMQGSDGALAGARPNSVWIQMSTIGEQGTARCAELAREHGIGFVDAPVLGTKQPAQEGKLVVMASGPQSLRERVAAGVRRGRSAHDVGRRRGRREHAAEARDECLDRVRRRGSRRDDRARRGPRARRLAFFDAIDGGPLDCPTCGSRARRCSSATSSRRSRSSWPSKDARLAVESAERAGLDLPALRAISARMLQAVPEHGKEDLSVTFLTSAPRG